MAQNPPDHNKRALFLLLTHYHIILSTSLPLVYLDSVGLLSLWKFLLFFRLPTIQAAIRSFFNFTFEPQSLVWFITPSFHWAHTVARADCGCSRQCSCFHGTSQQPPISGSKLYTAVNTNLFERSRRQLCQSAQSRSSKMCILSIFKIKHQVPTWDLQHNKVINTENNTLKTD